VEERASSTTGPGIVTRKDRTGRVPSLRPRLLAAWLLLTAAVAGCGGPPAREAWQRSPARDMDAGPGRHLVMPGDTVYGIARRYGVDPATIIRLNGLRPPYTIYVGQVLRVRPESPAPPRTTRVHRIRRGETLSHLAVRYRVPLGMLLAANPGLDPRRLRVGQAVHIPATDARLAVRRAPAPDPAALARARRAAATPPPPLSRAGFLWPVEGRVIARFGRRASGLENDGINIAAPEGTPVRAAEGGVVVYAGEAIPAFGRMVILRHAGGWLTAYAHNRTLLVTVGDVVRRGQVIAKVGRTGAVDRPQLHFQIRRGRRPVDPLAHLPPPRRPRLVAVRAGSAAQ